MPTASTILKTILMGYFASWQHTKLTPFEMPAKCLTHVNYAFAKIENGVIAHGNPVNDVELNIENPCWVPGAPLYFRGLIEAMNHPKGPVSLCNPDLKRLISIGGWEDSGRFSVVASTPKARRKFAKSIIRYIHKHRFHGADLDWEYPVLGGKDTNVYSLKDKENFVLLLKEIRDQMDHYATHHGTPRLELTVATAVSKRLTDNLDLVGMAELVDFFNLMIYEFSGAWQNATAHDAPFNPAFINSVQNYLSNFVSPEKIVTGMPLYGKQFLGAFSKAIGSPYQKILPAIPFDSIQENLTSDKGYTAKWDDDAKAGYLWNDKTKEFVTYESPNSSYIKAQYVRQKKLLGMFLWELSNDRYGVILRSILKGLDMKRDYRECFC